MKILITRPLAQATLLASVFSEHNIESIIFPALSIEALACQVEQDTLRDSDILIFVSPSTVNCFFKQNPKAVIDKQQTLLAMGVGTAKALCQFTDHSITTANPANSQGMLVLPELQQIMDEKIMILAGSDGKTMLADSLQERAATVKMLYTHQRVLPAYALPLAWSPAEVEVTLVTSSQSLRNLQRLIEQLNLQELYNKPLIVITTEMQHMAQQFGFSNDISIADSADNASLIQQAKIILDTRKVLE